MNNRSASPVFLAATLLAPLSAPFTARAQVFVGLVAGRGVDAIRLKSEASVNYTSSSASVTDFHQVTSPPILEVTTPGSFYNQSISATVVPINVGLTYTLLGEPDGGFFRLTLPSLPVLTDVAHESLLAELSGPGTFIQMSPGEGARTLNVNGTQNWTYSLSYFLNPPHGIDPDFSYLIDGGDVAASPRRNPRNSRSAACFEPGPLLRVRSRNPSVTCTWPAEAVGSVFPSVVDRVRTGVCQGRRNPTTSAGRPRAPTNESPQHDAPGCSGSAGQA